MKKNMLLLGLLLGSIFSFSQTKDYKVVFDCTSKDTMDHKALIRWLNEVATPNPDAQLEVVFYGQSLGMIVADRSVVVADIAKILANKNISFKVCAIALKNQHVDKSQLLPGIEIVPDGIYEIASKEKQGWGYIKVKL